MIPFVRKITPVIYVFFTSLIYYLLIFYFNQTNKTLVVATVLLTCVYWYKIRNVLLAVLLTYIITSVFFVGKSYEIRVNVPNVSSANDITMLWSQIVIRISDVYIFIMGLFAIRSIVKKQFARHQNKPLMFLLAFNGISLLSALIASKRPDVSLVFALQLCAASVVAWTTTVLARKKIIVPLVLSVAAALLLFESFIAGNQFLRNGFIGSSVENTGYQYAGSSVDENVFVFRPLGTFDHPNALAQTSVFLLPIFIALLYLRKTPISYLLVFGSIGAGVVSLLVSQSRSAWFSFGAGLLALLYIVEKRWKYKLAIRVNPYVITIFLLMLLMLAFLVLPQRLSQLWYSFEEEASGSTRLALMQEWGVLITRFPILGVGPGMSGVEALAQNATGVLETFSTVVHNMYLLIGAEQGIVGLWVFLGYILTTSKLLTRIVCTTKTLMARWLALGVLIGSYGLYINFFFQPYIGTLMLAIIFHTLVLESSIHTT
jgi:O-Antigen ligase